MDGAEHVFDILNRWAALSDDELARLADETALINIRRVAEMLTDISPRTIEPTEANFATIVREMHDLWRRGSRGLGEAIIKSTEYQRKGDLVAARKVHEVFMSSCPSEFYRTIARYQLSKIVTPEIR